MMMQLLLSLLLLTQGTAQDQYNQAKGAFDQKNFEVAASSFQHMLETLADPAVGAAATQPPLSDLRTLARGFRELSAAAIVPAPRPPAPVPAPPVPRGSYPAN